MEVRKVGENANQGIAASTRGLEVASRFFWDVGLPALEDKFPAHVDRFAAGLVAAGSDCSGNDDEISRDYDWGPRFQVFLPASDFSTIGKDVQAMLDDIPTCYEGAECRSSSASSNCAFSIDAFFTTHTCASGHCGYTSAPENPVEWLTIPEHCLYELTRGQVFYDPLGEFSEKRQSFAAYYPEDAWRRRLAEELLACADYGENVMARAIARDDFYTAQISWWRFVESAMRVGFLLNRRYAPDVKWLYREFCKLPELSVEVVNCLWDGQGDVLARTEHVSRIVAAYDDKLCSYGILTGHTNGSAQSFRMRAREVAATIADRRVSQLRWPRKF